MKTLLMISAALIGIVGVYATPHAEGPRTLPQLSMDDACHAVDAALAAQPRIRMNVAVVDADGALICFKHKDAAPHAGVPGAIGKAVASAFFGVPSAQLEAKMGAGGWVSPATIKSGATVPVPTLPGVAAASLPSPIYSQGAVPIIREGIVDGAIGCGGGSPEQDQTCAEAGVEAIAHPTHNM